MLDIKFIRENPDVVKKAAENKNVKVDIDNVLKLDEKRRKLQSELDELRSEKNQASKVIPTLTDDARKQKIADMQILSEKATKIETEYKEIEQKLLELLTKVPNIPDEDVPVGKNESENAVVRTVGQKPEFDFAPKSYLELAQDMDIVDTERAAKISGSRFGFLKGAAAMLEFALVQFTFQTLTDPKIIKKIAKSTDKDLSDDPFVPIVPPQMIREEPYWKMARLDLDQKEERYYIQKDELYLVGSAEHSIGPMHMDETFEEKDLPRRYIGFSTSFRREAGSYGRDTKGILRVHQFDKLEMESFCRPDKSRQEFEFILAVQEYLLGSLGIPYQVVMKCTGDIGHPNNRGVDLDSWMPGDGQYRETHTVDSMSDYQSRRLNTRVRRADGSLDFVHMIDATAFAIGRTLIAIIENYQNKDGTVDVPKALRPYVPFKKIEGSWGMGK